MIRRCPTCCLPALFLALGLLAGCSTGPGAGPLGLFPPEGHKLLDSTRALRAAVSEPVPLPRELDRQVSAPYVVEPGDVLLVQPVKFDSPARLPGDQTVLSDGTIHLGQYGQLQVAGKTIAQIEPLVKAAVEAKTPDAGPISVRVVSRPSKVFYVLGEVNSPGAFPWSGRETVLDAILQAGGLTERAAKRGVTLSRPTHPGACRIVLPVCYSEIVQLGDTSTNYQIQAGDRIFVPSKCFFEELFHKKQDCAPCNTPQIPCPDLAGKCSTSVGREEIPSPVPIVNVRPEPGPSSR